MPVHATDRDWETFAQENPYWAVLTENKYRSSELDPEALQDFFRSGEDHVATVFNNIRNRLGVELQPERGLDFGCGVGRLVIPMAKRCRQVVGLDVSDTMLDKARQHVAELGIKNVTLEKNDDGLSHLTRPFDFIHSYIVFQHIPVDRGLEIFHRMLSLLAKGGVGVLHLTYASVASRSRSWIRRKLSVVKYGICPRLGLTPRRMEMNKYPLPRILIALQNAGIDRLYVELTDHGGEYGAVVYFQKPK